MGETMIVRCPVCQFQIVSNGVTRGHETYAECLDALATELFVVTKKMQEVTRLNIAKSEQLKKEIELLNKTKLKV